MVFVLRGFKGAGDSCGRLDRRCAVGFELLPAALVDANKARRNIVTANEYLGRYLEARVGGSSRRDCRGRVHKKMGARSSSCSNALEVGGEVK